MTRMLDALRQIDDHSVFPIPLAGDVPVVAQAIVTAPAIREEPCSPEWSAVAEKILEDFPPGRPGVLWFTSPEPAGHVAPAVASLAAALACQVTGEVLAVDRRLRPLGQVLGHEEALTPDAARWGAALSELRRAYQLVLIDGSAAGDSETDQAVRLADAVYLVIALGRTGRRAAQQAVAALRAAGGRVLGCIVVRAIEQP
jgi:hypothetical protein